MFPPYQAIAAGYRRVEASHAVGRAPRSEDNELPSLERVSRLSSPPKRSAGHTKTTKRKHRSLSTKKKHDYKRDSSEAGEDEEVINARFQALSSSSEQ